MSVVTLQLPENLKISEFDLKMIVASKLFADGTISSGQAAEMVGISKKSFIELIGNYGVSLFGYGFDELEEEIINAS